MTAINARPVRGVLATTWRLIQIVLIFCWSCLGAVDDASLFGWQGESFDHAAVFGADQAASTPSAGERWIETLSWTPRAFLFHNFLSEAEANDIIHQAAPHLKRSTVVGSDKKGVVDNIRTSYGTFLNRLSSPTVTLLEERLANWTQLPIVHQEDVQILRYDIGQKYGAHYDALGRICTVLVYLADAAEGGETAFPKTTDEHWADPEQKARFGAFSECAEGHVAAPAKKGDALLFYSLKPDGQTTDSFAMHTGCPLLRGVKWTATVWIHPTPFRADGFDAAKAAIKAGKVPARPADPGVCADTHAKCSSWAASGECERNPGFMVGGDGALGVCRKACGTCTECAPDDAACYTANREREGYLNLEDEVLELTGRPLAALP